MHTSVKIYLGRRAEVFIWMSIQSANQDLTFERRDLSERASLFDPIHAVRKIFHITEINFL